MKALLLRLVKDTSGSGLLGQVLLISGVSLTIIPATQKIGVKLAAIFTKLANSLP